MAWKKLITEDDFGGFANPTATIGGAAVNGSATTALRSDAAPALGPLTRDLDHGGFKGTNAADPSAAQDLATKAYVDALAQGLSPKEAVRVRVSSNVNTASPGATLDGVSMAAGDRVLLSNQTTGSQNGIWVWNGAAVAMTRALDADSEADLLGASVFVLEGTSADTLWTLTTDAPITVGTTTLTWTQFNSAGDIVGGNGLTKTGNTLDVNVDGATIEINADTLRVKAGGITGNEVAAAIKDPAAGTAGLRTLGTGAAQACAGNDGRLSDTRVPAASQAGTAWDFNDNEVVALRPKGYTTGGRPGSAGIGRLIFDTTIARPLVWY